MLENIAARPVPGVVADVSLSKTLADTQLALDMVKGDRDRLSLELEHAQAALADADEAGKRLAGELAAEQDAHAKTKAALEAATQVQGGGA